MFRAAAVGLPVTGLTLVNPRHYHSDTALAVLSDTEIKTVRQHS